MKSDQSEPRKYDNLGFVHSDSTSNLDWKKKESMEDPETKISDNKERIGSMFKRLWQF